MSRIAVALLLCGLLAGCGSSTPATPPDDAESLRQAEEEGKKEGQREDAAKKGKKGKKRDRDEEPPAVGR